MFNLTSKNKGLAEKEGKIYRKLGYVLERWVTEGGGGGNILDANWPIQAGSTAQSSCQIEKLK
jgi:hypothetical protein